MGLGRVTGIVILAMMLFLISWFTEPVEPAHAPVYLLASTLIVFCCAAADRLWSTILLPGFGRSGGSVKYAARLLFWFMAGGMAYGVVLLAAKKFSWIPVRDIPFDRIYYTGGTLGLVLYAVLWVVGHYRRRETT